MVGTWRPFDRAWTAPGDYLPRHGPRVGTGPRVAHRATCADATMNYSHEE